MNIAILQRELDEVAHLAMLFDAHNFRARKEALDFVDVIANIHSDDNGSNSERIRLQQQAKMLGKRLDAFNMSIAQDWRIRLKNEHPSPNELQTLLQPYTEYRPQEWGKPHYGYENLDFLLDAVLLPQPHPFASLQMGQGMVRYQPTPASVILELTERIEFTDKDVFYDLGSGLGKVTMLVHLLSGIRCLGVEYQPSFCAYAAERARDLNLNNIEYQNADARDVDYSDASVFFFFNPFGGAVFPAVLERLRLEAQKREIRLASYGSSSQPLAELFWLERIPPVNEDESALAVFRSHA